MCIDVCPTDVLAQKPDETAQVLREEDCIGCTSCVYICPSRCITVTEYERQRPFHRIEQSTTIVARFLQQAPMMSQLQEPDFVEGRADVAVRLHSLALAAQEVLGRGLKTAGRKSGALSATHFPELYETSEVEEILRRLQARFRHAFDFEPHLSHNGGVSLRFSYCALGRVVRDQGEKVGDATLCGLYHEYWAGLLGTLTGKQYTVQLTKAGDQCVFELSPRA
jgi:NAD-dependent dihydropyrimidine dehydrogenase PreA subunit